MNAAALLINVELKLELLTAGVSYLGRGSGLLISMAYHLVGNNKTFFVSVR